MRYFNLILLILIFSSCGKTVNYELEKPYLETRKQILYYKGEPLTGVVVTHFEDQNGITSKIYKKESYEDGIISGLFEEYYFNGNIKQEGQFFKTPSNSFTGYTSQKDGKWRYYYESGQLSREEYYNKTLLDKEYILYHPNGDIKLKGLYEIHENKEGYLESREVGLWKTTFEDGSIQSKQFFNDNKNLEGETFKYDLDSKGEKRLISKSFYKNGVKDGEDFFFQESGKSITIDNYNNGFKKGKHLIIINVKSVDEEGNFIGTILQKGSYTIINSKKNPKSVEDGLWEYLFDDRTEKGFYKIVDYGDGNQESVKDGWWEFYDDNNTLKKKVLYYKNLKKTEIIYYNSYNLGYGWVNGNGNGKEVRTFRINEDKFGYVSYEKNERSSYLYKSEFFLNGKQYKKNIFCC